MGLVLTLDGSFPDADTEAAFVQEVVDLVTKYTADLSTAVLSTDFNGSPELPVGEQLPPLAITGSLPPATVGAPFSTALTASGGITPYTWAANGLPDGLNIDPNTGAITGTPNVGGPATVLITVTDSAVPSPDQVTATLPLVVAGTVPVDDDSAFVVEDAAQDSRLTALESGMAAILDKLNSLTPPTK